MRKVFVACLAAGLVFAAPAAADPPAANAHNCAGAFVSTVAEPGFGQVVAFFAHQQAVDNFDLANCGMTNRNNP